MLVNQIHSSHSRKTRCWKDETSSQFCRASVSFSDLNPSDCSRVAKVTWFLYVRKYSISPCTGFTFCLFVRFFTNGLWKTESSLFTISLLPKPETGFYIHKLFSLIFFLLISWARQRRKRGSSHPDPHLTGVIRKLLLNGHLIRKHTLHKLDKSNSWDS